MRWLTWLVLARLAWWMLSLLLACHLLEFLHRRHVQTKQGYSCSTNLHSNWAISVFYLASSTCLSASSFANSSWCWNSNCFCCISNSNNSTHRFINLTCFCSIWFSIGTAFSTAILACSSLELAMLILEVLLLCDTTDLAGEGGNEIFVTATASGALVLKNNDGLSFNLFIIYPFLNFLCLIITKRTSCNSILSWGSSPWVSYTFSQKLEKASLKAVWRLRTPTSCSSSSIFEDSFDIAATLPPRRTILKNEASQLKLFLGFGATLASLVWNLNAANLEFLGQGRYPSLNWYFTMEWSGQLYWL